MAMVQHLKRDEQQIEHLFDGAFTENKPIPFPDMQGTKAYSNLFYWAHLVAHETSEFPLHPHQGFEIMTFVFQGSVEHYDTASKVYTPLKSGDVQVIQAGSGVSHSERIREGTEMFQIWFDPDFSQTMKQSANYKDYARDAFGVQEIQGGERVVYVGEGGGIASLTQGLEIQKLSLQNAEFVETLDPAFTYSYYLLDGTATLDGEMLVKDDFFVLEGMESLCVKVPNRAELFVIKTPTKVSYRRFIERYR